MLYFDHAASTPVDARVVDAMLPYFTKVFANPSSLTHEPGRAARAAVEEARTHVARLLGADEREIVFTSGASESDNLALKGVARAWSERHGGRRGHIVTTSFEHAAVLNPCRGLERDGYRVTYVSPGPNGVVDAEAVEAALEDDTFLVSVIWTNNEIGTRCDVAEIGRRCRARGVLVHSDATQHLALQPVDMTRDAVDLLSLSGHKMHGPKGVGALYVRGGADAECLRPLIEGGAHEWQLRAGTLNVPGIVGLGHACRLCASEMAVDAVRIEALRDRIEAGLAERIGDVTVHGRTAPRSPHVTNVSFPSIAGARLVDSLEGVACSAGSAVASGVAAASHVLRAIGVSDDLAVTALRLSLGRTSTEAEVDQLVDEIASAVARATVSPAV